LLSISPVAIALKQDIAINITSSHFPYRRYDNQNHQQQGKVYIVYGNGVYAVIVMFRIYLI
jgi:hypothetical protein